MRLLMQELQQMKLLGQNLHLRNTSEEANLTLGDIDASKRKLAAENADLLCHLQELDTTANMLAKTKISVGDQLTEAHANTDNEAKQRNLVLGKLRNAEHDLLV